MSDRELLELAAKAAGLIIRGECVDGDDCFTGLLCKHGDGRLRHPKFRWNPLTDGDDALRLAARLNIDIVWEANGPDFNVVTHVWCSGRTQALDTVESVDAQGDAALCRAITRAAAEIGRGMG
jgi:hypothetical protein